MGASGGRLEIDQHLEYQRQARIVKKIAWTFMIMVIAAALVGLLGPGPLSSSTIKTTAGPMLKYHKFARYNAPSELEISCDSDGSMVLLAINSEYLKSIEINQISPEPREMQLEGDHQRWVFSAPGDDQPQSIKIRFRPDKFGSSSGEIQVNGNNKIHFKQYFLP